MRNELYCQKKLIKLTKIVLQRVTTFTVVQIQHFNIKCFEDVGWTTERHLS